MQPKLRFSQNHKTLNLENLHWRLKHTHGLKNRGNRKFTKNEAKNKEEEEEEPAGELSKETKSSLMKIVKAQ